MVNAKRMGVEIGRRFSATLDPAPAAAASPATPTGGSAAPAAATAPSATTSGSAGKVPLRQNASDGGGLAAAAAAAHDATMKPLSNSRNPFAQTVEGAGGTGGKVEAAADLLARVRDQLERSELRTKGLLVERQGVGDIAPPR